jgi:hypothetical protein
VKRRTVIIFGLCAFVVAVLALLPASIFESPLNNALAPGAQIRNSSGTIWSGSALVQLNGSQPPGQNPGQRGSRASPAIEVPITWSFAPTSLMRLRLGFDVFATGRHVLGKTTVEAGILSVQLRSVDLRLAMESLSQLNHDMAFLRPSGEVQFSSDGHALQIDYFSPNAMAGRLNFAANRVRFQAIAGIPVSVPLGSYGGHLIFNGQRIVYQIEKSSGFLSLNGGGHVVLGKPNEFQYQGFAGALPGSPVWLASTLAGLGRATPDGRVTIDYKTNW